MIAYLLLALAQLVGLVLIPFGLPGIWVQVLALVAYAFGTGWTTVGWVPVVVAVLLALAAEGIEWVLGGRFARHYGGGRRAMWGAVVGGVVGAFAGIPVPVLGSIIGSFLGSFAGAALMQMTEGGWRPALRTGWGAFLGRLAAVAVKGWLGAAVAVVALLSALR